MGRYCGLLVFRGGVKKAYQGSGARRRGHLVVAVWNSKVEDGDLRFLGLRSDRARREFSQYRWLQWEGCSFCLPVVFNEVIVSQSKQCLG